MKIHLYTNDPTLDLLQATNSLSTIDLTYEEPTDPYYHPINVNYKDEIYFRFRQVTVLYGYFITDDNDKVIFSERFFMAPYTMRPDLYPETHLEIHLNLRVINNNSKLEVINPGPNPHSKDFINWQIGNYAP